MRDPDDERLRRPEPVVWLNYPVSRRLIRQLRAAGYLSKDNEHDKVQIVHAHTRAALVGIKMSGVGA